MFFDKKLQKMMLKPWKLQMFQVLCENICNQKSYETCTDCDTGILISVSTVITIWKDNLLIKISYLRSKGILWCVLLKINLGILKPPTCLHSPNIGLFRNFRVDCREKVFELLRGGNAEVYNKVIRSNEMRVVKPLYN